MAARGRNRESGAGQERRLDNGVVGRSSIRRRRGVGNDRRIVGGPKHRELASQTIYHCLLLLFQLHVKLRGRQRPRVPQRSRAWPNGGIG